MTDKTNSQAVEAAAKAANKHWNEFGPEFGFDELMDALDTALSRATLASPLEVAAPVGGLGDAELIKILNNSELRTMHQEMGWYSAPEKAFREKGLALGRAIESAIITASRAPVAVGVEPNLDLPIVHVVIKDGKSEAIATIPENAKYHASYIKGATVIQCRLVPITATQPAGAGGSAPDWIVNAARIVRGWHKDAKAGTLQTTEYLGNGCFANDLGELADCLERELGTPAPEQATPQDAAPAGRSESEQLETAKAAWPETDFSPSPAAPAVAVEAKKGMTIARALREGLRAEVWLNSGTGPVACVGICAIQLEGWTHTAETAKAFADAYNRGAENMAAALAAPSVVQPTPGQDAKPGSVHLAGGAGGEVHAPGPVERIMGEACSNCHGSGVGMDGRPCPMAPHKQVAYKIKPTPIEPGSSIHFAMMGAEFGYNYLRGDEYNQMQKYSRKVWDAAILSSEKAQAGGGGGGV